MSVSLIAVSENLLISLTLYFLGNTNELWNFSLTHNKENFLFAALNIWFAFGAARLVVFRLVSVGDEMV